MNFLKRGWKSLTRKKGKSALLFAVVFVLGNVVAGAVSIQNATNSVEEKIKSEISAIATVQMDSGKMTKLWEEEGEEAIKKIKDPKRSTLKAIGELSYVKSYDYHVLGGIGSEKLQAFSTGKNHSEM